MPRRSDSTSHSSNSSRSTRSSGHSDAARSTAPPTHVPTLSVHTNTTISLSHFASLSLGSPHHTTQTSQFAIAPTPKGSVLIPIVAHEDRTSRPTFLTVSSTTTYTPVPTHLDNTRNVHSQTHSAGTVTPSTRSIARTLPVHSSPTIGRPSRMSPARAPSHTLSPTHPSISSRSSSATITPQSTPATVTTSSSSQSAPFMRQLARPPYATSWASAISAWSASVSASSDTVSVDRPPTPITPSTPHNSPILLPRTNVDNTHFLYDEMWHENSAESEELSALWESTSFDGSSGYQVPSSRTASTPQAASRATTQTPPTQSPTTTSQATTPLATPALVEVSRDENGDPLEVIETQRCHDQTVKKWYVVTVGFRIGVYRNWGEAKSYVSGCPNGCLYSKPTWQEASESYIAAKSRGSVTLVRR
ncbi:hypothetical protein BXZ70DRAFT_1011335 [Cristinia sonorae]|uniref:Ribonuclease H1 N-terminal domain-containing protein n=1 Tax=Cristinia sonorae TaxID=1940300 RepID=A0A8K0UIT8_9AGAR|nr:hypothetical protein BXZ70DRAFT_1011335 [Cristinia sonorae]